MTDRPVHREAPATVYLVGAGPGDPELLTLKGHRLMATCDVILFDHLADESLLALARDDAQLVYVGKTGAHRGADNRQQHIHDLLIEHAAAGRSVVRLKGGDPFVFGRGGEEAQALRAAGIPFEVVPGISSAIAAPAYAGIPVTHRNHNTALAIVTGHEDPRLPHHRTNWRALASFAASGGTLVVLMGVKNLARNVSFLLDEGVAPTTPAAMVRWGTRPDQRVIQGTLETIVAIRQANALRPPAVLIVGPVAALRDQLAWFKVGPLQGRRVLVTRSAAGSRRFAAALRGVGAQPIVLPTLDFAPPLDVSPLDDALNRINSYHWIAWTSARGVRATLDRLMHHPADVRALASAKLACVGSATAEALKDYGLKADLCPPKATAAQLARHLIEHVEQSQDAPPPSKLRVLAPLAAAARPDLALGLTRAGAQVDQVVAYRTVVPPQAPRKASEAVLNGQCDVWTFASPSALENLQALLGGVRLRDLVGDSTVACIGPVTAQAAEDAGLTVHVVPDRHTTSALIEALCAYVTPPPPVR